MPYINSVSLSEHWEELLAVKPKKMPFEAILEEGDELLTIETAPKAVSFSDPDYEAVVKALNEAPDYLKVLTIDVTYNEITFTVSKTLNIKLAESSGAVVMTPVIGKINKQHKVIFKRPQQIGTFTTFYSMYYYLMTTYFKSCFVDLKRNVKTESFRVLIDISEDLNALLSTLKDDFENRLCLGKITRKVYPQELTVHSLELTKSILQTNRLTHVPLNSEESLSKYYRSTKSGISLINVIPINPEEITHIELIAKEDNSINVHFHTLETKIKGKKKVEMGIGAFVTKYYVIANNVENTKLLNKVIEDLSTSVHMYMNRKKTTTEITTDVYFGYFHENYTKIETGGELYNSCMRGDVSARMCHKYYTKFIEEGLLDFVIQKDFEDRVAGRVLVWKDNSRETIYVDRYYPGISSMKNSIGDTIESLYKGKQIYDTGRSDLRTNFNRLEFPLAIRCDFMIDFFKETLCSDSSSLHTNHVEVDRYYGPVSNIKANSFYTCEYGNSFSKSGKNTKEGAQAFGELLMSSGLVIVTQTTGSKKVPYMDSFSRMIIVGNKCWLLSNFIANKVIPVIDSLRTKFIFSKQENREIYYVDHLQQYGPAKEITNTVEETLYKTFKQYKTIIINEK